MPKILEIRPEDFLTGIAPSAHSRNGGLFSAALGISPVRNPFAGSVDLGLLQTGPSGTDLTGGIVGASPRAACVRGSTNKIYVLDISGHLYSIGGDYAGLADLRSGTPITTPRCGLDIFTGLDGSWLYYSQSNQIGRWDLAGTYPTGWTDNWLGLSTSTIHAFHRFGDAIYFDNAIYVGKIYDNAGTSSGSVNVLDFSSDFTVTAISDDGYYLVVAASSTPGANNLYGPSKVVFWDTTSPSWQVEYPIADPRIVSMVRRGRVVYARGVRGLWAFTISDPPVLIRPMGSPSSTTLYPNVMDLVQDAIFMGGESAKVSYFGKIIGGIPDAYFEPLTPTGVVTMVKTDQTGKILIGTDTPKLYSFDLTSGGQTGKSASTVYFDLPQEFEIAWVDVMLGEPLASGDSFTLAIQTDEDTSAQTSPAQTFASLGAVKFLRIYINPHVITNQLKLTLNFTAGNVKVKRFIVYGEPYNAGV